MIYNGRFHLSLLVENLRLRIALIHHRWHQGIWVAVLHIGICIVLLLLLLCRISMYPVICIRAKVHRHYLLLLLLSVESETLIVASLRRLRTHLFACRKSAAVLDLESTWALEFPSLVVSLRWKIITLIYENLVFYLILDVCILLCIFTFNFNPLFVLIVLFFLYFFRLLMCEGWSINNGCLHIGCWGQGPPACRSYSYSSLNYLNML